MEIRRFDRVASLDRLTSLTELQRAAYATACAERMVPVYEWFQAVEAWGDVQVLRRSLDVAWGWVKSEAGTEQVTDAIAACEEVIPDTDDFSTGLASRALDAASALAQALETCLCPSPETALEAGEIAWECAFGLEQSFATLSDAMTIANWQVLKESSQGGLVRLEEHLQMESLEALRRLVCKAEDVGAFRARYGKLEGT
jgi:uncharacterized protein YjaG (DUF416 family)